METAENYSSVLFAGVTGNTRLQEKLGSDEALRAADRCIKRVARAIEASGGHVVRCVHNECIALFPNADAALHAAVEMQHRVADLPPVSGIKLAVRVGFSSGPIAGAENDPSGKTVSDAAHLAGFAGPGQILTADRGFAALSPVLQNSAHKLVAPTMSGRLEGSSIFQIVLPPHGEHLPTGAGIVRVAHEQAGVSAMGHRMRLRHASQAIVIDAGQLAVTIGWGPESNVHISDRRASRNHARIELKSGRFVLTDTSTNGTYVTIDGEPEIRLRQGECVLRGKGTISFASSRNSEGAEYAEFEQFAEE